MAPHLGNLIESPKKVYETKVYILRRILVERAERYDTGFDGLSMALYRQYS
jgi:hypothetical protein